MKYYILSIIILLLLFSLTTFTSCKSLKRVWCRVEDSCDLEIFHPSTIPEDVSEENLIIAKKYNKKLNKFLKTGEVLLPDVHESLLTFDKFILKNAFVSHLPYLYFFIYPSFRRIPPSLTLNIGR